MFNRKSVNTNFYSFWFEPTGNQTLVYRFISRRFNHLIIIQLPVRVYVLDDCAMFIIQEIMLL